MSWVRQVFLYSIILAIAVGPDLAQAGPLSSLLAPADQGPNLVAQIKAALHLLKSSERGRLLVRQSFISRLNLETQLTDLFQWGSSSRTDTTLIRHYNPRTGAEERSRKQVIFLNPNQTLFELSLDLAHELVHASSKPAYDPYDPNLTPAKYIHLSIEGVGGEVDAVYAECEIGVQISRANNLPLERCRRYLNTGPLPGEIDRTKILKGFYRVGNWKSLLTKELGKEIALFPSLSPEKAILYSSTGHAPYPVALFQEYEEITRAACENSVKRKACENHPSEKASSENTFSDSLENFMKNRCGSRL